LSDLSREFATTVYSRTDRFDVAKVNSELAALSERCRAFAAATGSTLDRTAVELLADLRYPDQIWDIEVPLPVDRFSRDDDVAALKDAFHRAHADLFSINDPASEVEVVGLRARVSCRLRDTLPDTSVREPAGTPVGRRPMYFEATGWTDGAVWRLDSLVPGRRYTGPGVVESSFTTVVVDPGVSLTLTAHGGLLLDVTPGHQAAGLRFAYSEGSAP
jgi:N-methylhydantoinase A